MRDLTEQQALDVSEQVRKIIDQEILDEIMRNMKIPRVDVINSFPYQNGTRHIVNIDSEILDWLMNSGYTEKDWHITGGTDKRVSVDEKVLNAMVLKYG